MRSCVAAAAAAAVIFCSVAVIYEYFLCNLIVVGLLFRVERF